MSYRKQRNHPWTLCCLGRLLPFVAWTAFAVHPTFTGDPEYLIDTWETEDGLPENSATAMVQTPDGYLWFGTFNGLVRFDGVTFTVLNAENTPELPNASVVNVHLDNRGWLWVSTVDGLVVRDLSNGGWRSFGLTEGWVGNYVRSFAERTNGDLLLTTFDGHVLEFAKGQLSELPQPGGRRGEGYLAQVDEQDHWRVVQQWFVGSWNGEAWVPDSSLTNLFSRITGGGAGSDKKLWLTTHDKVVTSRHGEATNHAIAPVDMGNPWGITEDSKGNLWIATFDRGLSRLSPTGEWRHWGMTNGLSYESTRFVFEDHENNLWIGTTGGGLQRFKPRRFQSFGPEQGLPERSVRSVAPAPDGSLWIATYGKGLCKLKGTTIEPVRLPSEEALFSYTQSLLFDRLGRLWVATLGQSAWMIDSNGVHPIGADCTGGNDVFSLFEDSRGRVWIASAERIAVAEGLDVGLLPEGPELIGVRCFAEDSKGVIWLASHDGVFRLERDGPVEVREGGKSLRDIGCLKADPDGTMWLGSLRSGLRCWRNNAIKFIGPTAGLPVLTVNGIVEDRLGCFWLTSNHGIGRVRRSDLLALADGIVTAIESESFDLSDGLPSLECRGGQQPTCASDASGRLWFATSKGVAMVDPGKFGLNLQPPRAQIESLGYERPPERAERGKDSRPAGRGGMRAQGIEMQTMKISSSDTNRERSLRGEKGPTRSHMVPPWLQTLTIPAGSRHIHFHYTAPSFVSPEKVRFQVKLDGHGAGWEAVRKERMVDYDDLPPGKYVFHIRAANNDGIWNDSGASLAFSVEPFIWQTTEFRVGSLVLLFGAGGVTGAWRLRARHRREVAELQRRRQQELELAHAARVSTMGEFASSVVHELNQPLGAIRNNLQAAELFLNHSPPALDEVRAILRDIRKDDERAGQVISRMSNLLRKGEMEMARINLNSIVEDVLRLLSADASSRRTVMRAELPPQPLIVEGDRVHLQQVLLNLILNGMEAMAKEPPQRRRITVHVSARDGIAEMAVIDSGCGIEPDKLCRIFQPFYTTKPNGMGMGLSIAQRIVEAHNGHISAENRHGGGTTIRVVLPRPSG